MTDSYLGSSVPFLIYLTVSSPCWVESSLVPPTGSLQVERLRNIVFDKYTFFSSQIFRRYCWCFGRHYLSNIQINLLISWHLSIIVNFWRRCSAKLHCKTTLQNCIAKLRCRTALQLLLHAGKYCPDSLSLFLPCQPLFSTCQPLFSEIKCGIEYAF